MIVMTRDGTVVRQDPVTAEQRDMLWAMVFSAFLRKHPEEITGGQVEAEPAQARSCGSIPTPLSICAQD